MNGPRGLAPVARAVQQARRHEAGGEARQSRCARCRQGQAGAHLPAVCEHGFRANGDAARRSSAAPATRSATTTPARRRSRRSRWRRRMRPSQTGSRPIHQNPKRPVSSRLFARGKDLSARREGLQTGADACGSRLHQSLAGSLRLTNALMPASQPRFSFCWSGKIAARHQHPNNPPRRSRACGLRFADHPRVLPHPEEPAVARRGEGWRLEG